MSLSSVRRRCMTVLRELEVPDPFDLGRFCEALAARRGRRLHLHNFPMEPAASMPCGVYLSLAEDDYIFVEGRTSQLHRDHIVLHEISHMLLGHGTNVPFHETAGRLMPSIDPRVVRTMLARTSYSTDDEREAEMLATLIGGAARSSVDTPGPDVATPILDRLQVTLSHAPTGTRGR